MNKQHSSNIGKALQTLLTYTGARTHDEARQAAVRKALENVVKESAAEAVSGAGWRKEVLER